jgi:alpha-galactosidase
LTFAFLIILLAFPRVVLSDILYPASSAVLSRGAVLDDCPTCQNGKRVTRLGGDDNGSAVFTNIVVPKAGLYAVAVHFLNTDDASFDIYVNHEDARRSVIFRRTARGADVSSQTIFLPFHAGANSVAFDNFRESGPDLEGISVGDKPIESHSISGTVTDVGGAPVSGAEMLLSGTFEHRTMTDDAGHYEFNFLPNESFHVSAKKPGAIFVPPDHLISPRTADRPKCDFTAKTFPPFASAPFIMELDRWRIVYDLSNGVANVFSSGRLILNQIYAEARLPEMVTSMGYKNRKIRQHHIHDHFGYGVEFDVESFNSADDKMVQSFWLYKNADFFLTKVAIVRKKGAASNFMAPLVTDNPVELMPPGDNRALWVPFDNDKWVRYNAFPFGTNITSYEVSALYNNDNHHGLVVGSIDHDTWKTGVRSSTSGGSLNRLEVFAGVTSSATRDTLPHGKIFGTTIQSPRVFVGFSRDWRQGLDSFAKVNAEVAPPRRWKHGVPFGWNSWGKLAFNISYDKAIEVSDFFATELQPHNFENDHTVYIGLDAGWNSFSDDQLKKFVKHCKANHQEAGIYFTPFTDFGRKDNALVEGSKYRYRDIYLYANGWKQRIAGGIALDPTHPGTRDRIKYNVDRFKKFGFKYFKADFMVHGLLEGDHFHDPAVTTGLQAYNEGMKYFDDCLGPSMYLNLAISPLFPSQYANSRRIACDAWGDINKIEYTLNANTYGWWLGWVYDFNDPDHVVLGGYTDGENRARVTSALVTGMFITGDDFSKAGDRVGKDKARKYLTNPDIDALIRLREHFHPMEGNTGNRTANVFFSEDSKNLTVAVFNYSSTPANIPVRMSDLGFNSAKPVEARELWSGRAMELSPTIAVPAADVIVLQYAKEPQTDKQHK